MADLAFTDKTRLKLPFWKAVSVAGFLISVGGGIAVAQLRLNTHESDIKAVQVEVEMRKEADHQLDRRQSVSEEQNKSVLRSLERIEGKLDHWEREHQ